MALHAPRAPVAQASVERAPHNLPPWLRHALRTVLHVVLDSAAVAGAYALAYRLRFGFEPLLSVVPLTGVVPDWSLYRQMLCLVVPLWMILFASTCRLYTGWMNFSDRFLQVVKGCFLGTAGVMFATYIYSRLEYSRLMMALAFPISVVLVSAAHLLVLKLDEWLARYEDAKPVLVIGAANVAEVIRERIRARHPGASVQELRELPTADKLRPLLEEGRFYELILLRSSLPHDRILEAAELCESRGVGFRMVPDLLELRLGELQMDHSLGLPAYRIQHTSMARVNFAAKRTFDLAFSFLLLLATLPVWLVVWVAIKLDSKGPVLYKQKRYGLKAKVFEAYKFRTMVVDAESKIAAVKDLNTQKGAFFKAKHDPRVTRVGRFLRRFSLDEFPQFLNVLRGEMSVVGPRPLALTTGELEQLEREFGATARKRMNILPGITGLWQVSGRSDVSSEQRFSLDMFYIEHWSLGMDLQIILRTVPAMVFGKGAY